jgi:hypothetical protein
MPGRVRPHAGSPTASVAKNRLQPSHQSARTINPTKISASITTATTSRSGSIRRRPVASWRAGGSPVVSAGSGTNSPRSIRPARSSYRASSSDEPRRVNAA